LVQANAVGQKRYVWAETGGLELTRGLFGRGLCLKRRYKVRLVVRAAGTSELDELVVKKFDKRLRLAHVGLEERFLKLLKVARQR
jgi:hypothetical protein